MRATRLVARRSAARRSLLLSLFAVVAVVAFLLAGMTGYLAGAADTAVRETLTSGPAKSAALQLTTRLADASEHQTDAVQQLIDRSFADVVVTSHRTVRSSPVTASLAQQSPELVFLVDPGIAEHATLVDGSWPSGERGAGASPVAVQAMAATELGLEVGDRFTVEGQDFVVEGTWFPLDATAPYWFADPAVASGYDQLTHGPIVTLEGALAALPVRSYAQWTIVPTDAALAAERLPQLAGALDALAVGVERADTDQGIDLSGTLGDRIEAVQRSLGVAGALVAVPAVLVAVIGLITLAQLARLLVSVRRSETALVRARGASVTQLTVVSVIEAVAVIVPGIAVGAVAVIALLGLGIIPLNSAALVAAVWPVAVGVAVISVAVWGTVSWRAALVGASPVRGESGRTRASATVGATVLVLAVAVVSLWQFKLYGSPLVVGQDGVIRVDPLTVVAPALVLLALVMLGLLAFGPIARLVERSASRSHGILPVLPIRQVARRAPVFGVALLLITLSVGGTTLTAFYSQTWEGASATAAGLANGADVRVRLSPPTTVEASASPVSTTPYLRLPGADDAATVLRTQVRIADDSVGLTALAAARMPTVLRPVEGSVDPARLASALGAEPVGVPVDGNELQVSVQLTAAPGQEAGQVELFAWLQDADGALVLSSLGSTAVADATPNTLSATVPHGREGWTVLAVEASLSAADGARDVLVSVTGLDREYALTVSSIEPTDRALTYAVPSTLPVVVTEELAQRLSLETGSTLSARIPRTASPVRADVVGVTPAIPATDGRLGMIADLPTLNRYLLSVGDRMLQASEVWIEAAPDAELVEPAVAASVTSATVTTPEDHSAQRVIAPALVALWWGTAGALLLAAIAVLAITGTFARDRRGEVVVLRALGLSSAEQGRNRVIEMASVVGAAVVTGAVAGMIASALTVSELATTAAGAVVAISARFDLLGWVALVLALAAGLVTILTGYGARVSRQARDSEHQGETW